MVTYSISSSLFMYRGAKARGDPIAALESVAAAGFRETELLAEGEEWEAPGPHDVSGFRNALEGLGIKARTIHTPYVTVNLASPDEGLRKRGIARITDAMRFGAALGVEIAVVHPSGRPGQGETPYALENIGVCTEYSYLSLSELVKVAEETGVRIALENLSSIRMACRPLVSVQELRAFIAGFPAESVGICLDVGHSRISALDPADQARIASERLLALHLQDVDGQEDSHWIPGQGVIDWPSLGTALSDIGFNGARTIEALSIHSSSSVEQIARGCAALRERWEADGMT